MTVVDHVIVFGDSLSDIGRKWGQAMGGIAARLGDDDVRGTQMLSVNATGRFSDSKNWTDYMFEDSSGTSLISASCKASKEASKEHHRLSSRWISPSGGHRFRYANYAVGGAVGWEEKSFQKWVGLTRFSDQVNEFEEDFAKLVLVEGHKHRFLFIVMFGANDIYTDEKASNRSCEIANGIARQCVKAATIVNRRLRVPSEFIVAGVGFPAQSHFYVAQEADKILAARKAHKYLGRVREFVSSGTDQQGVIHAAYRDLYQAEQSLRDWKQKCSNLHQQVTSLNSELIKLCTANNHWRFFALNEALTFVADNASVLGINPKAAQTLDQYEMISHRRQGNHFEDPNDVLLKMKDTSHHALFTADQKHPTSKGYEQLWKRMQMKIAEEGLNFGILAGPDNAYKRLRWVKDEEVDKCHGCKVKFSTFKRKHHCRECGKIFCDDCTRMQKTLNYPLTEKGPSRETNAKKCRVCKECKRLPTAESSERALQVGLM
jgi:hypothetical protein